MLQRRQALGNTEAARLSQQITNKLRASVDWSKVNTLHIYTSQAKLNEVDTLEICQVISKEYPAITVAMGSPSKHALIQSDRYDLIIVPLVAFDDSGHRIGFGGGWYDRFLSTQPQAQKIGLAYELQRVESILVEPHDEALNAVVTEARIYLPNKNTLLK